MSINGIFSITTTPVTVQGSKNKAAYSASADSSAGVIYESGTQTDTAVKYADPDLVARLKKDAEERTAQLQSLVEKTMLKQSSAYSSIWEALASGTLTFDEETVNQAQKDIAEDGYWGVEQTSDRILSFAKALAGDDPKMLEKMRSAVEKGFKMATKAWGKDLPDISNDTYNAVMKKFDDWAAEANTAQN